MRSKGLLLVAAALIACLPALPLRADKDVAILLGPAAAGSSPGYGLKNGSSSVFNVDPAESGCDWFTVQRTDSVTGSVVLQQSLDGSTWGTPVVTFPSATPLGWTGPPCGGCLYKFVVSGYAPATTFTGVGLDDATFAGTSSASAAATYRTEITANTAAVGSTGSVVLTTKAAKATGTVTATTKAIKATGTLTAVAKASLVDTETFTLDDGVNPATVFEFDVPPDGVAGANVVVDVSADVTNLNVATRIFNAINGVGATLAITAVDNGDGTVGLTNDAFGTAGNTVSGETVLDGGFALTNMTGGQAGILDTETVTLNDGTNAVVFEFSTDGVAGGGNQLVNISTDSTDLQVAARLHTAINAVGAGLTLTSTNGGAGVLTLTNDAFGTAGNAANSETVAAGAFAVTNMTGGLAGILDTETLTLDDGTNPASVFEFSTDGVAGGANVLVDISADSSAIQVAARLHTAINAVGAGLRITSTDGGAGTLTLANDLTGTATNETITETVAAAALTVAGMIGGDDAFDTFRWRKDAGAWTSGVRATGAAQTLTDGVTVTFAAASGHTIGDLWDSVYGHVTVLVTISGRSKVSVQ